jgi:NAD(P)-dependent dehydrogenase (short-subunit alcohol dehydrogenase family)
MTIQGTTMHHTPFDLTGKVAVVTGSSRGIGRSSAELLAKLGAKVVISSRKADACEEVAASIRKNGGDAHVIACNISRREEVEALIAGTTKHYGKIDILVCNAAVNPYYGPLLDIKDDAFDKIMNSNVKSNIWLCQLAIPQNGRARQRLGGHYLFDRRTSWFHCDRRLRNLQGRGFCAVPQPRR